MLFLHVVHLRAVLAVEDFEVAEELLRFVDVMEGDIAAGSRASLGGGVGDCLADSAAATADGAAAADAQACRLRRRGILV